MAQGHRLVGSGVARRAARRSAAGGVVGAVMVGTALLGGGTASALDCSPLPLVGTALYQQCKALGQVAGGATSAAKAVPRTASSAAAAVPKAVAPVVPKVVPKVTRPVTGATAGAATGGSAATAPSASSAGSSPAASSPAAASAPAGPVAVPAPAVAAAAAPMTFTTAFDSLPASFLAAAAPGGLSFASFSGVGGAYDPGLLLTSSTPLRSLAPSPVTSGSSAVPLSFLGEDGRVGTPVLLSVLSVAVVAALGVRAGVLRRARRRGSARTA